MAGRFFRELKSQIVTLNQILRTREFWIYVGVILLLLIVALGGIWLSAGFDPLTREHLRMSLSCNTGEGKLATIIVGGFVFGIATVFTIGEVVDWVETMRMARAPGRHVQRVGIWRPLLYVLGTVLLGLGGSALMRAWCA